VLEHVRVIKISASSVSFTLNKMQKFPQKNNSTTMHKLSAQFCQPTYHFRIHLTAVKVTLKSDGCTYLVLSIWHWLLVMLPLQVTSVEQAQSCSNDWPPLCLMVGDTGEMEIFQASV